MDNYLIDREVLEEFIDELIKQKPLPAENAEELNTLKEKSITALDDKISDAIFGSLSSAQLSEFNQLLDSDEDSPEIYQDFFEKAGINLKSIMTNTMEEFSKEFLGGKNV